MYYLGDKSSADIKSMLDQNNPSHRPHIDAIDRIEAQGIRYSHQDYDVLSAAKRAAT